MQRRYFHCNSTKKKGCERYRLLGEEICNMKSFQETCPFLFHDDISSRLFWCFTINIPKEIIKKRRNGGSKPSAPSFPLHICYNKSNVNDNDETSVNSSNNNICNNKNTMVTYAYMKVGVSAFSHLQISNEIDCTIKISSIDPDIKHLKQHLNCIFEYNFYSKIEKCQVILKYHHEKKKVTIDAAATAAAYLLKSVVNNIGEKKMKEIKPYIRIA
jgi:hypothetical protein